MSKKNDLNNFIVTCESLLIEDIATEAIKFDPKAMWGKLKQWFRDICAKFWEIVGEKLPKLKKKVDSLKNKKEAPMEELKKKYEDLQEAFVALQKESVSRMDKETSLRERSANVMASQKEIIENMKKRNSTLKEEKRIFEEDYKEIYKLLSEETASRSKVSEDVTLFFDYIREIGEFTEVIEYFDEYNEHQKIIDRIDGRVKRSTDALDNAETILEKYKENHSTKSYNKAYFRGLATSPSQLREKEINRLSKELHIIKRQQDDLNNLIDKFSKNSELSNQTAVINAIKKYITILTRAQSLLIRVIDI